MVKHYTWIQSKKGFCAIVLKHTEGVEIKQYTLEHQKKFLVEVSLDENALDSFVKGQEKAIKLTEVSEADFIKLREKTEQWKYEKQALSDVKALRLKALNAEFDALINKALGEVVPSAEMLTWEAQERESNAYLLSNPRDSSLCPTMLGIANARGVELETLCQKCKAKSEKYRALSALAIGKRQGYQDAIERAATQNEVFGVEFNWGGE